MWAYVFVRQYLREKDPQHYTGQESFLMRQLQAQDLKFMPVGKAICLEAAGSNSSGIRGVEAGQSVAE